MISVVVSKNRNNEYLGFECKGHAGYDDYGKDIVCAAVSMLVINTINAIELYTDSKFQCDTDENKGVIKFHFISEVSSEAKLLLDAMILGIDTACKNYGKAYVTLKIKEV